MINPIPQFSDRMFLDILSLSKDATAIYLSPDLHIGFVNNAMLAIWGKDRSVVGETFENAIPEMSGQPFTELLKEVWRSGESRKAQNNPATLEIKGQLQTSYFDFEYQAIKNEDGTTRAILHTAVDVTERMEGWRLVGEKEQHEQALNEELRAGNEELTSLNEEYQSVNEELNASNEELKAAYDKLNTLHDTLIITEEQARLAKNAASLGMFDLDVHADRLQWDDRCKDLFGVDPGSEVSYTDDFVAGLHPDDRERINAAVAYAYDQTLSNGKYDVEYRTVSAANGDIKWVRAVGQVHFDQQGQAKRFIGTVMDITEMVIARNLLMKRETALQDLNEELIASNEEIHSSNEELTAINEELQSANEQVLALNDQLMISEQGFRSLIQNAPVAMVVFRGQDMYIEVANEAMLKLLDKHNDIIGQKLFDAVPELEGQKAADSLFEVYHTGKPVYGNEIEVRLVRNGNKEMGYFNFAYTPIIEKGEVVGVIDMAFEVTDQVLSRMHLEAIIEDKTKFEKGLKASERRLQGILDTMAEGVGIVDMSGKLVYANPMAQRILGLTESEILERTYHDQKWANLHVNGSPLKDEDHPMAIMLRTGLSIYDQEIAVQPPGGELFYISINAAPIIDQETGQLTGGIGTFMDVTNRRKMLMQKDDFISVASHELKTPVTSLKGALQLLSRLQDNIKPEMLAKLLLQANKSLDKLSKLINELLNTNRISQGQLQLHKTNFSVAELVHDCCQHIRTAGSHEIMLKGDMDIMIHADEQQLDQVLVNFVNNAVKYAPHSREIVIQVDATDSDIKISVTDQGPGVHPDKLPHLFDRYYRTDYSSVQFSGLGLGLYISSAIIKKHGGEIGADSELGKGSTFWFTIPRK